MFKKLINLLSKKEKQPTKYSEKKRELEYINKLHKRAIKEVYNLEITDEESELRMAQVEAMMERTIWH